MRGTGAYKPVEYHHGESDIETFEDLVFVCDSESDICFTYGGRDYTILGWSEWGDVINGHSGWFLNDVERYIHYLGRKSIKPLSDDYESFEALTTAPILDGKSIRDRISDGSLTFFVPRIAKG